jgi:hypothetical protein
VVLFTDFQDKLLEQFFPSEYYGAFSGSQKDNCLREIISRTTHKSMEWIFTSKMFGRIIDNHTNSDNIVVLQNAILEILILQREEYFTKFVSEVDRGHVSGKIFDRVKKELALETKRRVESEADVARARNIITGLMGRQKPLEDNIQKLTAAITQLEGELAAGAAEISKIRKKHRAARQELRRAAPSTAILPSTAEKPKPAQIVWDDKPAAGPSRPAESPDRVASTNSSGEHPSEMNQVHTTLGLRTSYSPGECSAGSSLPLSADSFNITPASQLTGPVDLLSMDEPRPASTYVFGQNLDDPGWGSL